MQSSFTPIICSTCLKENSIITDSESGEVICSNCGMVISEKVQDYTHQEQRVFTLDKVNKISRTGAPTSLARPDMGLYTVIGKNNKDASGHELNMLMRSSMARLRKWDTITQSLSSRVMNLRRGLDDLNRLKDKLGLSNVIVEKTAYIYRKAQERGLVQGKPTTSVLAAAIYIACREMETPRTLKEISTISNVKRKEIAKNYRMLVFQLDIKIPAIDPMNCIIRIANKIKLSDKTKHQAIKMMKNIAKEETIISAGKSPTGFAASLIYLASIVTRDDNIRQMELAEAAGVTEVTIRNICKFLRKYIDPD
ncbi:MAG TPA: TFIIB-type zinc ribbon-containing protein [Nitrososphaeraceae archaeon]